MISEMNRHQSETSDNILMNAKSLRFLLSTTKIDLPSSSTKRELGYLKKNTSREKTLFKTLFSGKAAKQQIGF